MSYYSLPCWADVVKLYLKTLSLVKLKLINRCFFLYNCYIKYPVKFLVNITLVQSILNTTPCTIDIQYPVVPCPLIIEYYTLCPVSLNTQVTFKYPAPCQVIIEYPVPCPVVMTGLSWKLCSSVSNSVYPQTDNKDAHNTHTHTTHTQHTHHSYTYKYSITYRRKPKKITNLCIVTKSRHTLMFMPRHVL